MLNNDSELEPNAVINVFSEFEGVDYLSLVCVGTAGNGNLEWEKLSGSTGGFGDNVAIDYYSTDRRSTIIVFQPVTEADTGYYSCQSEDTEYEATVLVTFENPYFSFTSFSEYEIPLGVAVDISARYAYSSNGIMNIGSGFIYDLTFLPYYNATLDFLFNETSGDDVQQEELLDDGSTDAFSNNYVYTVYGSDESSGQYNLICEFIAYYMYTNKQFITLYYEQSLFYSALFSVVDTETQNMYQQTTDIIVTSK